MMCSWLYSTQGQNCVGHGEKERDGWWFLNRPKRKKHGSALLAITNINVRSEARYMLSSRYY